MIIWKDSKGEQVGIKMGDRSNCLQYIAHKLWVPLHQGKSCTLISGSQTAPCSCILLHRFKLYTGSPRKASQCHNKFNILFPFQKMAGTQARLSIKSWRCSWAWRGKTFSDAHQHKHMRAADPEAPSYDHHKNPLYLHSLADQLSLP